MKLKDVLFPPFQTDFIALFDAKKKITGNLTFCAFGDELSTIENRGLQQDFMMFFEEALNEKAEREWGGRRRWLRITDLNGKGIFYRCERCLTAADEISKYCPECGIRLYPPKKEKS